MLLAINSNLVSHHTNIDPGYKNEINVCLSDFLSEIKTNLPAYSDNENKNNDRYGGIRRNDQSDIQGSPIDKSNAKK